MGGGGPCPTHGVRPQKQLPFRRGRSRGRGGWRRSWYGETVTLCSFVSWLQLHWGEGSVGVAKGGVSWSGEGAGEMSHIRAIDLWKRMYMKGKS